ncbi:MAG: ribosome silencing factor [Oceanospirillales bacterium TMED91]|nr:ribosome silencing factor [Gammaproteobacteria bacterium]OUX71705.1 MAG: ribosome silencing factor [Oceanospirillales bacterium TMED91]
MTEDTDLTRFIVDALEDLKALDIRIVDVRGQTSVTDFLVIASGTSSRHVKSLADHVAHEMKAKHGVGALGSEGADAAEWVLVDFDSVVLHVMQPPIREFYDLERLWERRGRDADEESAH